MNNKIQPRPLSFNVGKNTRDAIHDGYAVLVHGDEQAGKGGCKANADMRKVLGFNAENADIVGAKTWAIAQLLDLDEHITQDDLMLSLVTGKQNADDGKLWDVTPEEVVEIVLKNGGRYVVLKGKHEEKSLRVDVTEDGAFAKAAYRRDLSTDDKEIQAFAASFGAYKKMTFDRTREHDRSEREAALKTLRVIAYNVGLSKWLGDEAMPVGLISKRA